MTMVERSEESIDEKPKKKIGKYFERRERKERGDEVRVEEGEHDRASARRGRIAILTTVGGTVPTRTNMSSAIAPGMSAR